MQCLEEVSSIGRNTDEHHLPLRRLAEKPLSKDLISCSQEKGAASSKIGDLEERTVVHAP